MNDQDISSWTDKYFTRTKEIVVKYGDVRVTYAVFIRRPVLMACDLISSRKRQTRTAFHATFKETMIKARKSVPEIRYSI